MLPLLCPCSRPGLASGLLPPQRPVPVSELGLLSLQSFSCPVVLIGSAVHSFSLVWGAGQEEQEMSASFLWLVGPQRCSSEVGRSPAQPWPQGVPALPLSCHC